MWFKKPPKITEQMSPPASSSRDIQTESRKEVVKSVGPEMKLSKDRRSSSSLDYVSPLAFKESPVQGTWPKSSDEFYI